MSKRKKKEVIGLMNDELNGHIMKGLVRLRAKAYSYLKDNNDEDKKTKGTEECVIKRKLKFIWFNWFDRIICTQNEQRSRM